MSIRIGLYEFYGYVIPGVVYLFVIGFALHSFEVVNLSQIISEQIPLVWFFLLLGAGYIVGHVLDIFAYAWLRLYGGPNRAVNETAYRKFKTEHPWISIRLDPQDWTIISQAIERKSAEASLELSQHNATSVMLRNVSLALCILSIVYLVYFFVFTSSTPNLLMSSLLFTLSVLAIQRSHSRRRWFYTGIYDAFAAYYLSPEDWISDTGIEASKPIEN